jgi:thiamine pyrophosphate-dependent acetolactate synthase large subunit-like protein
MPQESQSLRLVLNVKIDYTLNGADPSELRQNLATLVQHAQANGMITGDSAAAIDELDYHVEGRDRERMGNGVMQSPAAIIAWLQRQADDETIYIDDGGFCLRALGSEGYLEIGGLTPDEEEE